MNQAIRWKRLISYLADNPQITKEEILKYIDDLKKEKHGNQKTKRSSKGI